MKFNKKVIIWMIMILSMLLGGCGASLGSSVKKVKLDPDNPTKVTIWHYYNGDQLDTFNNLAEKFNETVGRKQGITVDSKSLGTVEDLEKMFWQQQTERLELPKFRIFFLHMQILRIN